MQINNILLDLDGVLSDFLTLALAKMEAARDDGIPPLTSANYYIVGGFDIAARYGVTLETFWETIEAGDTFWSHMEPFPWAWDLVKRLQEVAPVTICTSPSLHPICATQKIQWVKKHLGLSNSAMMIGGRKYLMAKPNNLLIDDYPANVKAFRDAGGSAVLVPSNWNTPGLTYTDVLEPILPYLP